MLQKMKNSTIIVIQIYHKVLFENKSGVVQSNKGVEVKTLEPNHQFLTFANLPNPFVIMQDFIEPWNFIEPQVGRVLMFQRT